MLLSLVSKETDLAFDRWVEKTEQKFWRKKTSQTVAMILLSETEAG